MNPQQFELENSKMFDGLRETARQHKQIPKEDYIQQIDRWNEYQKLLDKLQTKTRYNPEVTLKTNVKTNMKTWSERSLVFVCCCMIMALSTLVVGLMSRNFVVLGIGAAATIWVSREVYDRLLPPQNITFRTSPKLHFDELQTARRMVRGIPSMHKDPVVRLPALYMSIPRRWFGQQGIIEFMKGLDDLDWEITDKLKDEKKKYRPK